MTRNVALLLVVLLFAACSSEGNTSTDTSPEAFDLTTPVSAAASLCDAFAGDDFASVWLAFSETAQARWLQSYNSLDYDSLIDMGVSGVEDEFASLGDDYWQSPDPRNYRESSKLIFAQFMALVDRLNAFVIDLSDECVLDAATVRDDLAEVPAQVSGVDGTVRFRLKQEPDDSWRVYQIVMPDGDETRIPWAVPSGTG